MKRIRSVKLFNKITTTVVNFKKTAYHHYGNKPSSLLKFFYYSVLRLNTFWLFENDLTRDLPDNPLDSCYKVMKPPLEELARIREGLDLPREFYYDQIFNLQTFYLAFKDDELAYIHWVLFSGDNNRFLILPSDTAELNYNTTIRKFRGNKLSAKMISYICKDLQAAGYKRAFGVIHEANLPSINAAEDAGFRKVRKIKSLGPFNRKIRA